MNYYDNEECTVILVVGLPGSGKSTWARKILRDGLCYDLDAIAYAFSLGAKSNHAARSMANDFLPGFVAKAREYTDRIVIIRTAPTEEELYMIDPSVIVWCQYEYLDRGIQDRDKQVMKYRLTRTLEAARKSGIPIKTLPPAQGSGI